ncbi:hypothetical protein [Bradyrhizobium guangzhouense]|uniref:Uncharacterized protein n=1 Tax=Bradyrhizobium guangzhouense TaxID=1325095 RepID=A0AAE5WZ13_9BRAD|nr:hypothetical protein [Bradyrhizobium guangzhouense]QAU45721.1 hypothetical protein XH91_10345 [Bradyrhizobium guangzhouense]RXH08057.1 hypothetical protein EAS56_30505 [Bradyrhizobium guangzhouense]
MLSRIPAVKWAFNRLRPLPHSGSIELTPSAADEQPAVIAIAEAAPTAETIAGEDSSPETLAAIAPGVVEEISICSVEIAHEPVDAPELISSDPPAQRLANVEPDDVDEAPAPSVEVGAIDAPEPVVISGLPAELLANADPELVEEAPVASAELEAAEPQEPVINCDADIAAPVVAEVRIDTEAAPDVVMGIEPVVASDPVADVADAPVVAAQVEAPPAATPKKPRAKIVEPTDRAALIRQRWAETGIRMWNPRLHGTGDAALNIQGRIGLLPPEPGETMPRYDKLEFRMLGGQVVCEGVIVEAPVHAGQRSFTRLAEPRGADRNREPVRERQVALA